MTLGGTEPELPGSSVRPSADLPGRDEDEGLRIEHPSQTALTGPTRGTRMDEHVGGDPGRAAGPAGGV